MRVPLWCRLGLLILAAGLALPDFVLAQGRSAPLRPLSGGAVELPAQPQTPVLFQGTVRQRDSLVNGMLIGAGIGAVVGMLVAPPAFCGANDSECATIVRVAIGLPSIAGGLGVGALVDALNSKDARPAGVAFNVRW